MSIDIKARLEQMGLALPGSPGPNGQYSPVIVHNGIAYVAGQVSRLADGVIAGPASPATSPEVFRRAAEACVLRALAVLAAIEDRYAVERLIYMRGYVHATSDFTGHSAVLDPASDLLHSIFGDRGRHARSAIGVASLPSAGLLEIEIVAAVSSKEAAPADGNELRAVGTLSMGGLL